MQTTIHPVGFYADNKLEEYIYKKLSKLDSFHSQIINADVYLKLESHEQVKDKVVEIKINLPGVTLFAAETAKTFEESTDMAVESIGRQVIRRKDKEKNI